MILSIVKCMLAIKRVYLKDNRAHNAALYTGFKNEFRLSGIIGNSAYIIIMKPLLLRASEVPGRLELKHFSYLV